MISPLGQKAKRNWRVSWWRWKKRVKKLSWNSTFKKVRSWHLVPSLQGKWMRKQWKQWQTLFYWAVKSLKMVTAVMKLKDACPWKKSYDQCRQCIKKQRHKKNKNKIKSRDITLLTKVHIVKAIVFPVMHELDHKEGWALKNWCFWTVVLEKTLETPSDCKEIKLVNSKGNQYWIFVGRTDAEADAPLLWPHDSKNWLFEKDPGADKDWRMKEKGTTEDEMVGCHHRLNWHEFEQALGVGDG